MTTLERFLVLATACVAALVISAWVSAPPRQVRDPFPEPTGVAMLCAEIRGDASPERVGVLASDPGVPVSIARAGVAYASEPTPARLDGLRLACG